MSPTIIKTDDIIDILNKERKAKFGLICLSALISRTTLDNLKNFASIHNIEIDKEIYSKTGFLLTIAVELYKRFKENKDIKKQYPTALDYLGDSLLKNEEIADKLLDFDFISKSELIDAFSDFCADLGISVFDASEEKEFSLDLYLTKKTPLLKTENVIVRTGLELSSEENYIRSLELLESASVIGIWNVYVTTPRAVTQIGLKRMIKDMDKYNAWLYVVDPIHQRVLGITKGKKSKDFDAERRDEYIRKLPRESIRSPSQVVKISKYEFSESDSYKPDNYSMYEIISDEELDSLGGQQELIEPKYRHIFNSLLIIDKESGLLIQRYSIQQDSAKDELTSSFLSAMDSFVSELAGTDGESLKEISYKGFFIQAVYSKNIKMALFLSEPAEQALKDRLTFFTEYYEQKYAEAINKYKRTSDVSSFSQEKFEFDAKRILSI